MLGEIRWRWDKSCVAGPAATDPVLTAFKFAWLLGRASAVGEKLGVDFTNEPETYRLFICKGIKSVLHSTDIARYLGHVITESGRYSIGLVLEEVR